VTGRGVQQNGVRVGDKAEFVVHTEGAGDGDLNVVVEGPGGVEEPVRLNKVGLLLTSLLHLFSIEKEMEKASHRGTG